MMQAEEYLEKIPMWTREKHSLTDIRAFLHEMGDPDRKLSIIHVAGTNGKGSVCAFLTSLYRNAGFSHRNLYLSSSGNRPGTVFVK